MADEESSRISRPRSRKQESSRFLVEREEGRAVQKRRSRSAGALTISCASVADEESSKISRSRSRKQESSRSLIDREEGKVVRKRSNRSAGALARSCASVATRLHEIHAFCDNGGENEISIQIPEHISTTIQQLPGNSRCCDCGSPFKDTNKKELLTWASIAHGTIICGRCAFRHLCGGREKEMKSFDSSDWTFIDILSMLEGGNETFLSEISLIKGIDGNTNDLSPACTLSYGDYFNEIYFSQSTSSYKKRLREKVLNIQKVAKCFHRISTSFPGMQLDDAKASKSTDALPLER